MTQKHKELLLKDLCARLPYGVKIKTSYDKIDEPIELIFINPRNESFAIGSNFTLTSGLSFDIYECKPYLIPLLSMTEEQKEELLYKYIHNDIYFDDFTDYFLAGELWHDICVSMFDLPDLINWLNKNHFDYRGLIPMGLAIDATGLNIY